MAPESGSLSFKVSRFQLMQTSADVREVASPANCGMCPKLPLAEFSLNCYYKGSK